MRKTVCFLLAVLAVLFVSPARSLATFSFSFSTATPQPGAAAGFTRGRELVLFDQDGMRLALTGEVRDEGGNDIVLLGTFENHTDKALSVTWEGTVNGAVLTSRSLPGSFTEPGETGACEFDFPREAFGLRRYTDLKDALLSFEVQILEVEKSSSASSSSNSSQDGGFSTSSSSSSSFRSGKPMGTYRVLRDIRIRFAEYQEPGDAGEAAELTGFAEMPALPSPVNFVLVAVRSSSSSSSNGKFTSASYAYGAAGSDDIAVLLDEYLKGLAENGFEVFGKDGEYMIIQGNTLLAKITLDGELFRVGLIF